MDLLLFHRDIPTSLACHAGGVDGLIIDLETRGKAARQAGFDTEINNHTLDTLTDLRRATDARVLCRLSGPAPEDSELDAVILAGADEVIVPMLRSPDAAARIVNRIAGRIAVTLMIETADLIEGIAAMAALPVRRFYVGLNDLHISRGTDTIFDPLSDGVLDRIRRDLPREGFGFGGLTLPHLGAPLPARHLYNELNRLGADFTFLRRSFYRDGLNVGWAEAIAQIRAGIARAATRDHAAIAADRREMVAAVNALPAGASL